eukprot:GHRR01000263.1.p1 GENE.GHRR01000263.1~~GHRR01000263.1.p1  ORF type:complete len:232 (+),score=54.09 GHRR01000263.1:76-771(+)
MGCLSPRIRVLAGQAVRLQPRCAQAVICIRYLQLLGCFSLFREKMVFGLGHHHHEEESAYNSFYGDGDRRNREYEGNKQHEGLAGAAAFYAMKKYEERREAEGHKDHEVAREMLAAIAGAEVDKFAEREGMEWQHKERAKAAAQQKAINMYDTYYVQQDYRAYEGQGYGGIQQTYDPNMGYARRGMGSGGGEYGYEYDPQQGESAREYRQAVDDGYEQQQGGYNVGYGRQF